MIPLDETNAINNNSIYRYRILPDLAEITPPIGRYVANVYGRELPRLRYDMGDGTTAVISLARGGFNNSPPGDGAEGVNILKEVKVAIPVPGARHPSVSLTTLSSSVGRSSRSA